MIINLILKFNFINSELLANNEYLFEFELYNLM